MTKNKNILNFYILTACILLFAGHYLLIKIIPQIFDIPNVIQD